MYVSNQDLMKTMGIHEMVVLMRNNSMGLIDRIRNVISALKTRIINKVIELQEDHEGPSYIDFSEDSPGWPAIWKLVDMISEYTILYRRWSRTVEPLTKADVRTEIDALLVDDLYAYFGLDENDIAVVKQYLSALVKMKDLEMSNIEDIF